ncbi:PAS domain-containing sensor histidine kinase [Luteimonas pelagia]
MPEHAPSPTSGSGASVPDADFRLLVEAVSDYAIFLLDPDGRIRSWNRGARKLKGYAEDEVVGRHFSLFYPDDKRAERWPEQELAYARRDGRFEDEGWRIRKDGSRFWANVVITCLRDANGEVRGFAKVTRDLTERRNHEELLRQSEERFRLMVEGVRDYAIFMLDPDGRVASWNLGAQLNKGYLAEEIIGKHFSVFYPQDKRDAKWPEEELERALRDGRFEDAGWRIRKDGSRFWANVVITALHDANGRHIGFAKVTRDMTSSRRIDALQAEQEQLTQFLAVLGHELRNPLAPIANAVQLMRMETLDNPRLVAARDILVRQVVQLRRLVDDLLDVGRIASGRVHMEQAPVHLQSVVEQAVEASAPQVEAGEHTLSIDVTHAPLWVMGDHARLVQVASNLLHNAAKFTPPGGRIAIRLSRHDDRAEISVRDNGPGIDPQHLAYVFRLFAQAEPDSTKRMHGGLGVGLSLVHRLVTDHGGDVSAFSSGVAGEGAEFIVSLPLVAPPADA